MNNGNYLKMYAKVRCFRAFFNVVFSEIKTSVFILAHHWTQSASDGKAPTDFKGNSQANAEGFRKLEVETPQ